MLFDLLLEKLVDLGGGDGFIDLAQFLHFGEYFDAPMGRAGSETEPGDDFHAFFGEVLGAGGGGGGAAEKLSEFYFIGKVLIGGVVDRMA